MFLMHYVIVLAIFYFLREKIMIYGLLLGNLVDLDHVYYRIIGKVGWFESACPNFGMSCSIGIYPLHNLAFALIFIALSSLVFFRNKKARLAGWIFLGAFLNIFLDCISGITGVAV